jgi:hypothetical protein
MSVSCSRSLILIQALPIETLCLLQLWRRNSVTPMTPSAKGVTMIAIRTVSPTPSSTARAGKEARFDLLLEDCADSNRIYTLCPLTFTEDQSPTMLS